MSDIKYQISSIKYQVSVVKYQLSSIKLQVSHCKYQDARGIKREQVIAILKLFCYLLTHLPPLRVLEELSLLKKCIAINFSYISLSERANYYLVTCFIKSKLYEF